LTTAARPLGVTLLALLHVLQAVLLFVGGLALLVLGEFVRRGLFRFPNLFRGLLSVIGAVLFIIALLYLVLAYGLWTGKGWAVISQGERAAEGAAYP
jgi:hypothetical protein